VPVVGKTETIFDTGTTLIVGDMVGIQQLYIALVPFGALPATPLDGVGLYTSTWASSAADQAPHNV
jgi:uncharacterized membrane protein